MRLHTPIRKITFTKPTQRCYVAAYFRMSNRVVILGGGIAGLSAAHELIERGFSVEVYEALSIPGGKARSMGVPGSATRPGRKELPGEHGFASSRASTSM